MSWRTTGVPAFRRGLQTSRAWSAVLPHVAETAAAEPVEGLFGPAVPVADDGAPLDRIVALSGRDPGWGSGVG